MTLALADWTGPVVGAYLFTIFGGLMLGLVLIGHRERTVGEEPDSAPPLPPDASDALARHVDTVTASMAHLLDEHAREIEALKAHASLLSAPTDLSDAASAIARIDEKATKALAAVAALASEVVAVKARMPPSGDLLSLSDELEAMTATVRSLARSAVPDHDPGAADIDDIDDPIMGVSAP